MTSQKVKFGLWVFFEFEFRPIGSFCFVWVWNLVADIAGGKEAEGVWEHGVEENIWTEEGRGNGGIEEIA